MTKARPYGLRGALEIRTLIEELDGSDAKKKGDAEAARDALAKEMKMVPKVLERTFREIEEDPYTSFISEIWG